MYALEPKGTSQLTLKSIAIISIEKPQRFASQKNVSYLIEKSAHEHDLFLFVVFGSKNLTKWRAHENEHFKHKHEHKLIVRTRMVWTLDWH